MSALVDPHVDLVLFGGAHHRLLTIREVPDRSGLMVTGWRLWCMSCGREGERLYQDVDLARRIAEGLRSSGEPKCKRPA